MSLRAFIQHNFWLKLFSLLLATLVWFLIHFWIESGNPQPQSPITNPIAMEFLRLPVRVLTQPGDVRVYKVDPNQVVVKVTGEAAIMRDLTPKNISVYVDLANIQTARETNQQVKLNIPNGVTLMDVVPRAVNVEQVSP
jgi:YbbR domain-containing protein